MLGEAPLRPCAKSSNLERNSPGECMMILSWLPKCCSLPKCESRCRLQQLQFEIFGRGMEVAERIAGLSSACSIAIAATLSGASRAVGSGVGKRVS